MWITHKQLGHAWNSTKTFFKNTYAEGKKWGGLIDGYARLFRKGLSAAVPMLQDLGADQLVGHGVRALSQYDTARKTVMDLDSRGREHYDRIASAVS